MKNIDLFDNYYHDYDATTSDYPKIVSWKNPEDGQPRQRVIRSKLESDAFFDWFLNKHPEIKYTVD